MKNIIIAFLSLSVVGLGAYVVVLKKDAQPEPIPELAIAEKPAKTAPKPKEVDPFEALLDEELEETPKKAKNEKDPLMKANDLISSLMLENQTLEEKTKPSLMNGLKQLMEAPELKELMRAGMANEVKRSQGSLFRRLDLTPEEEESLTELLISQNVAGIETSIQWMTGDHEKSAAKIKANREKTHQEIEALLGPEKLVEYKYWENTKNERDSVRRFNRNLGDEPLDDETSDQLVDMMYDARGDFEDLDHLSQPENFNPKEMTPERQEDIMGQVEELHEVYVEEAAPILNEDQLTSYESSLEQQRNGLSRMLETTHSMFNREETPDAPNLPVQP